MKVLVIIPAYNEEKTIESTVKKLMANTSGVDYVIINDCSTDNTLKVCQENGFNVLNLPVNLGIGGAVQTGYKYALENNYDIAIQMDADGQHDPKYISQLVDKIVEGNDFVIGSRFVKKEGFQSSVIRRVGIKLYSKIIKFFTKTLITDTTSGYRAANKDVIKIFSNSYPVDYPEPETNAIIAKAGYSIVEIPVIMKSREAGKSSITPKKSIYYALKVGLAVTLACISKHKEVRKNG